MRVLAISCLLVVSAALSYAAITCEYGGKHYPLGDFLANGSPCQPCHCGADGKAYCAIVDCFFTPCVDSVQEAGHCCRTCPNGQNCRAPDGHIIKKGETYRVDAHTTCTCTYRPDAQCAHSI